MAGNRVEPDTPSAGQNGVARAAQGDFAVVIPEAREGDAFQFPERRRPIPRHRGTRRIGRRLVVGLVSVVLGAGAGLLTAQFLHPEQPPRRIAPGMRAGEVTGPVVPEVTGLSAAEARDRLLDSSLRVVRLVPTPGEPGVVMRARPGSGRSVTPGTGVILYVGVDQARFEEESNAP
jgi:hypothetical protein